MCLCLLNETTCWEIILLKNRGKCQFRVLPVYLQYSLNCCQIKTGNWWKQLVLWLWHLWTWQALTDRRPAPLMGLLWASESSPMGCYSVPSLWACFRWELTQYFCYWETVLTIFFFRIFHSLVTVHLYAFY